MQVGESVSTNVAAVSKMIFLSHPPLMSPCLCRLLQTGTFGIDPLAMGLFVFHLQEIQQVKTPEELENFMLKHGENIIDTLGAEVDRLEKELKVVKEETLVLH